MNTLQDRIRSTKAQFRIAVKQYNQARRIMDRIKISLEKLEMKNELARAKSKAKPAK